MSTNHVLRDRVLAQVGKLDDEDQVAVASAIVARFSDSDPYRSLGTSGRRALTQLYGKLHEIVMRRLLDPDPDDPEPDDEVPPRPALRLVRGVGKAVRERMLRVVPDPENNGPGVA